MTSLPSFNSKLLKDTTQTLTQRFGLDVPLGDLSYDLNKMSLVIPFASGLRRDGVGDLLEVTGIDTSRHKLNPIVLFDHGKRVDMPLGMAAVWDDEAQKYDLSQYTVTIDPVSKEARLDCYFYRAKGHISSEYQDKAYQHALFCEQTFDMAVKGLLRGGSIGYQTLESRPMPPDYTSGIPSGQHLIRTLMLEGSLVVMPANADTVRKCLDPYFTCCGKSLSPYLKKCLGPYCGEKVASMGWEPGRGKGHSCGCNGACACGTKSLKMLHNPHVGQRVQYVDKTSAMDEGEGKVAQVYGNQVGIEWDSGQAFVEDVNKLEEVYDVHPDHIVDNSKGESYRQSKERNLQHHDKVDEQEAGYKARLAGKAMTECPYSMSGKGMTPSQIDGDQRVRHDRTGEIGTISSMPPGGHNVEVTWDDGSPPTSESLADLTPHHATTDYHSGTPDHIVDAKKSLWQHGWKMANIDLSEAGRTGSKILRHEGSKWVLYSHHGRMLGKHDSQRDALKQETAINISKHKDLVPVPLNEDLNTTHIPPAAWRPGLGAMKAKQPTYTEFWKDEARRPPEPPVIRTGTRQAARLVMTPVEEAAPIRTGTRQAARLAATPETTPIRTNTRQAARLDKRLRYKALPNQLDSKMIEEISQLVGCPAQIAQDGMSATWPKAQRNALKAAADACHQHPGDFRLVIGGRASTSTTQSLTISRQRADSKAYHKKSTIGSTFEQLGQDIHGGIHYLIRGVQHLFSGKPQSKTPSPAKRKQQKPPSGVRKTPASTVGGWKPGGSTKSQIPGDLEYWQEEAHEREHKGFISKTGAPPARSFHPDELTYQSVTSADAPTREDARRKYKKKRLDDDQQGDVRVSIVGRMGPSLIRRLWGRTAQTNVESNVWEDFASDCHGEDIILTWEQKPKVGPAIAHLSGSLVKIQKLLDFYGQMGLVKRIKSLKGGKKGILRAGGRLIGYSVGGAAGTVAGAITGALDTGVRSADSLGRTLGDFGGAIEEFIPSMGSRRVSGGDYGERGLGDWTVKDLRNKYSQSTKSFGDNLGPDDHTLDPHRYYAVDHAGGYFVCDKYAPNDHIGPFENMDAAEKWAYRMNRRAASQIKHYQKKAAPAYSADDPDWDHHIATSTGPDGKPVHTVFSFEKPNSPRNRGRRWGGRIGGAVGALGGAALGAIAGRSTGYDYASMEAHSQYGGLAGATAGATGGYYAGRKIGGAIGNYIQNGRDAAKPKKKGITGHVLGGLIGGGLGMAVGARGGTALSRQYPKGVAAVTRRFPGSDRNFANNAGLRTIAGHQNARQVGIALGSVGGYAAGSHLGSQAEDWIRNHLPTASNSATPPSKPRGGILGYAGRLLGLGGKEPKKKTLPRQGVKYVPKTRHREGAGTFERAGRWVGGTAGGMAGQVVGGVAGHKIHSKIRGRGPKAGEMPPTTHTEDVEGNLHFKQPSAARVSLHAASHLIREHAGTGLGVIGGGYAGLRAGGHLGALAGRGVDHVISKIRGKKKPTPGGRKGITGRFIGGALGSIAGGLGGYGMNRRVAYDNARSQLPIIGGHESEKESKKQGRRVGVVGGTAGALGGAALGQELGHHAEEWLLGRSKPKKKGWGRNIGGVLGSAGGALGGASAGFMLGDRGARHTGIHRGIGGATGAIVGAAAGGHAGYLEGGTVGHAIEQGGRRLFRMKPLPEDEETPPRKKKGITGRIIGGVLGTVAGGLGAAHAGQQIGYRATGGPAAMRAINEGMKPREGEDFGQAVSRGYQNLEQHLPAAVRSDQAGRRGAIAGYGVGGVGGAAVGQHIGHHVEEWLRGRKKKSNPAEEEKQSFLQRHAGKIALGAAGLGALGVLGTTAGAAYLGHRAGFALGHGRGRLDAENEAKLRAQAKPFGGPYPTNGRNGGVGHNHLGPYAVKGTVGRVIGGALGAAAGSVILGHAGRQVGNVIGPMAGNVAQRAGTSRLTMEVLQNVPKGKPKTSAERSHLNAAMEGGAGAGRAIMGGIGAVGGAGAGAAIGQRLGHTIEEGGRWLVNKVRGKKQKGMTGRLAGMAIGGLAGGLAGGHLGRPAGGNLGSRVGSHAGQGAYLRQTARAGKEHQEVMPPKQNQMVPAGHSFQPNPGDAAHTAAATRGGVASGRFLGELAGGHIGQGVGALGGIAAGGHIGDRVENWLRGKKEKPTKQLGPYPIKGRLGQAGAGADEFLHHASRMVGPAVAFLAHHATKLGGHAGRGAASLGRGTAHAAMRAVAPGAGKVVGRLFGGRAGVEARRKLAGAGLRPQTSRGAGKRATVQDIRQKHSGPAPSQPHTVEVNSGPANAPPKKKVAAVRRTVKPLGGQPNDSGVGIHSLPYQQNKVLGLLQYKGYPWQNKMRSFSGNKRQRYLEELLKDRRKRLQEVQGVNGGDADELQQEIIALLGALQNRGQ